jgi:hypothetical protein
MIGIDLAEVADIGEHNGGGRGLELDVLLPDLVGGNAHFPVVDGFFLFEVDGYWVLFDEWEPAIGLDEQVMRTYHAVVNLEGGVVEVGIIVDRSMLMIVLRNFFAAGGIPGLLDDDGVVGGAGGVVVEDNGVGQAGGDCFFAAKGIVAGLGWGLLTAEVEEDE